VWRSARPGGTSISGPLVFGVTGKYCSGKNAVTSILIEKGFSEIDVDRIGHGVLERSGIRIELRRRFGDGVFTAAGAVDRRLLGRRVFRNPRELRVLESIVHPPMAEEVRRRVRRLDGRVVINAAVLFRMGLERLCHAVICVRAPLLLRLARARRRDRTGLLHALRRTSRQRGICPKLNGIGVDIYYVDNDRGLDHLHDQILMILREKGRETS
jgi:dephospho-CoA kinase